MAEPNFKNRTLYHGDNLEFLRGMNSETVHLIATDPPFNKNRDFHATPDSLASGARFKDRWSWDKDVHEEWTDSIQDDWPAVWEVIGTARATYGDDMGAFLCWLGVRLLEMQRVLREDGSIYLHIDHTAHAYVKCVMDAIFGAKNFRNEIVWCYRGMPSKAKRWQQKHDIILFGSGHLVSDATSRLYSMM
ncbi:MAG: site-specific DNA-methyltransferase, partial [Chloroflexi bacterium]|nr:site-specific DNA-methyltransferase [Chloroflexota bacterium]